MITIYSTFSIAILSYMYFFLFIIIIIIIIIFNRMYFKAPLNGFYLDIRRYTNKLIIIIIIILGLSHLSASMSLPQY